MEEGVIQMPLGHQESENRFKSYNKDEILSEFKKLLYLAGPLMTINLLIFGLSMISVMFVGHLGKLALSGASMATSFASVTGMSLMVSSFSTFYLINFVLRLVFRVFDNGFCNHYIVDQSKINYTHVIYSRKTSVVIK